MSKNTQISELINYISVDGSGNVVFTTVPAAASNTDKFLVSDAGTLKFRTAAQLLSDIGAQASGSYLTTSSASSTYLPLVGGTLTGGLIGTTASFSSFITAQSTGGSGLRIYGSSGTNQWDMYLNGTNLRFSDNTGTGNVVFDRHINGATASFNSYVTMGSLVANDPGSSYYSYTNRIGGTLGVSGAIYTASSVTATDIFLNKTAAGIFATLGGNTPKMYLYQFSSGNVMNYGHNFYYNGTDYGKDNLALQGWQVRSHITNGLFSVFFSPAGTLTQNEIVTIDGANQRVGIGTTSPTYKLDVSGTTRINGGDGLYIRASTGEQANFFVSPSTGATYIDYAGFMAFRGSSEFMRITSGGNVVVGGITAGTSLNTSVTVNNASAGNYTGFIPMTADVQRGYYGGTSTGLEIGVAGSGLLDIYTNGSPRIRVTSGGNVGIATTNPTEKIEVKGNIRLDSRSKVDSGEIDNITFTKDRPDASTGTYEMGAIRSFTYGGYAGGLTFYSGRHVGNGNYGLLPVITIGSTSHIGLANAGIGTTAPIGKLHILNASGTGQPVLELQQSNSGSNILQWKGSAGSYLGTITNDGTLSINTTAGPVDASTQKLQVYGAIRQDVMGTSYGEGYLMNFPANGTNYGGLFMHQTSTAMTAVGASSIKWQMTYNYAPELGVGNGGLAFTTANTNTRLFLASGGNVLVGTTSDNGNKFQVNGSSYLGTNAIFNNSLNGTSGQLGFTVSQEFGGTSFSINLASLLPNYVFSGRAISVILQVLGVSDSVNGTSVLYNCYRGSGGAWTINTVSTSQAGSTGVSSVSGSGTTITVNFNTTAFGVACATVINRQ